MNIYIGDDEFRNSVPVNLYVEYEIIKEMMKDDMDNDTNTLIIERFQEKLINKYDWMKVKKGWHNRIKCFFCTDKVQGYHQEFQKVRS